MRAIVYSLFIGFASPLLIGNADPAQKPSEQPAPIPPPVQAMLDAALKSNNDGEIQTVAKYARTAAPEAKAAIDRIVNDWRNAQIAARTAKMRDAGPFDMWKGKAEVGGYYTTGNTQDVGISGAVELVRETLRWRHKLNFAADYKESAGLVSREHYLAAYEPNFKFSDRGYVYGAAQYESDPFLGYDDRYSASIGAGLSAIKEKGMKLDVELGPAYRKTSFTDTTREDSFAARGSVDFDWHLTNAVSVSQDASAYLQNINSTVSSTTALNAKLIGPLAAKLSYAVQYESAPPIGRVGTDTTSKAALVYSF